MKKRFKLLNHFDENIEIELEANNFETTPLSHCFDSCGTIIGGDEEALALTGYEDGKWCSYILQCEDKSKINIELIEEAP